MNPPIPPGKDPYVLILPDERGAVRITKMHTDTKHFTFKLQCSERQALRIAKSIPKLLKGIIDPNGEDPEKGNPCTTN